ncbi:MAG: YncE family protein [Myxococcota bacterium]
MNNKILSIIFFLFPILSLFILFRCGADMGMTYLEDGGFGLSDYGSSYRDAQSQYDTGYTYDYGNISKDTGYVEPEKPNPYAAVPPITSQKYLYILNPSNNSIAVIEPETLKVFSIKIDFSPKNLLVIPNTDYAIVLAENASRLAMLSIEGETARTISFSLGQAYNDISVSPDGKYIIAFFNEQLRKNNEVYPGEGRINLINASDISLLINDPNKKIYKEIGVGRRITNIFYSTEQNTAYIVCKERIYILRFDDPFNERGEKEFIDIDPDFTSNVNTRFAYYVPNTNYIILKYITGNSIFIASTDGNLTKKIDFEGAITDLKFTKDMTKIIISFRDIGKIKIIPVPDGIIDISQIKEIDLGNFMAGSVELCENETYKKAILYTNVYYREEIAILNLEDYTYEKIDHKNGLNKAINYIVCAPDGNTAIIIHKKGNDPDEDDPVEINNNNQEGFSVFGLKREILNTELLSTTQPKSVSFLYDSNYAMITATNATINDYKAYMVDLSKPIIKDDKIQFFSDIIYTGSIPQKDIFYVLQKHPVGRISFIFMPSMTMKTITGFELNSLVQ